MDGAGDKTKILEGKLVVSVKVAGQMLEISRASVYSLMNKGLLPYTMIGGLRRIPVEALQKLVAQNMAGEDLEEQTRQARGED